MVCSSKSESAQTRTLHTQGAYLATQSTSPPPGSAPANSYETTPDTLANAEMEVQKPKYGSKKKSHLSVSSALLTHDCAQLQLKGDCL